MIVKRIALVVVLIAIAWLLTAYKDRVPERVLDIGAQDDAATSTLSTE